MSKATKKKKKQRKIKKWNAIKQAKKKLLSQQESANKGIGKAMKKKKRKTEKKKKSKTEKSK
jgi:hypothetical protein